jgi:transposase-like protein
MSKKRRRKIAPASRAGAQTSEVSRSETERGGAEASDVGWRPRPGRRSAEERTQAVLALLSGKATVDQLAARHGVQPATIEQWRQLALEGVESVLRQGSAKPAEQVAVERELEKVREAFTDLAIRHELLSRAMKDRPSKPERSPR